MKLWKLYGENFVDFVGRSAVVSYMALSANNVVMKRCRLTRLDMASVDHLSVWDNSSVPLFFFDFWTSACKLEDCRQALCLCFSAT